MNLAAVRFAPIDAEAHGADCVRFRRDSFVSSFGSDEAFIRESGADGAKYLDWLRERIREFSEGFVHVWNGDSLVGQVERRLKGDPRIGYVNLFYLVPEARGISLGDALHDYCARRARRPHRTHCDAQRVCVAPRTSADLSSADRRSWRSRTARSTS